MYLLEKEALLTLADVEIFTAHTLAYGPRRLCKDYGDRILLSVAVAETGDEITTHPVFWTTRRPENSTSLRTTVGGAVSRGDDRQRVGVIHLPSLQ